MRTAQFGKQTTKVPVPHGSGLLGQQFFNEAG
jgi:hypothetical protein